jgi:hypothetical protein
MQLIVNTKPPHEHDINCKLNKSYAFQKVYVENDRL